jgi:ubiquitin carboxyl-terminal hydrolase 14
LQVSFGLQLDIFEHCTPTLQAELKGPRWAFRAAEDAKQGLSKPSATPAAAAVGSVAGATSEAVAPAAVGPGMDVDGDEMMTAVDEAIDYGGAMTGRYDLIAVLTHKGRTLDSGHYIGWVKQTPENTWVQFDDDKLIPRKDEDILKLGDGGDWHTAYLMLYRAQRVPVAEVAPAP